MVVDIILQTYDRNTDKNVPLTTDGNRLSHNILFFYSFRTENQKLILVYVI